MDNRAATIYRGCADCRQEAGRIDGRADLAHAEGTAGGGAASIRMDRAVTTVTSAASSRSVGAPRTTLTSGSSSIDRAYDDTTEIR